MTAESLWEEGQNFYRRHLPLAALDRFRLLAMTPGADLARAHNAAGLAALRMREFEPAEGYLLRSLAMAREQGQTRATVRALLNLMVLKTRQARPREVLHYFQQAAEPFASLGDAGLQQMGLVYAAVAHGLEQRWQEALALTRRALDTLTAHPNPGLAPWIHNNMGAYLALAGEVAEARHFLNAALDLALEAENPAVVASASTELAFVALTEGDWASTALCGRRALDYLWNHMIDVDKAEVARLSEVFGRMALAVDDRRRGAALLERSATYYAQLDLWREWSRVSELARSGGVGRLAHSSDLSPEGHLTLRYFTDLFGLLDNIEGADPDLSRRSHMVTHYALLLAAEMGLPARESMVLSHAGRLADIGLTTFDPEEIMDEAGARYRLHPELGARWLEDFSLPPGTAPAVAAHHERYDGSGFPHGLAGGAIPLASRLLAVCEAYVRAVLTGVGHDRAMQQIEQEAGSLLDPEPVAFFNRLHRAVA